MIKQIILSKEDLTNFLNKDSMSCGLPFKKRGIVTRLQSILFCSEEWKFVKSLRWLEYCENTLKHKNIFGFVQWCIAKYKFRKLSIKLGYSIPINVFGPGLSLPHRGNIIINPNTIIGENCRIHVGVNIGAHKDGAPIIGNNVYIGPGAILFGKIIIGNNVSIGANATVTKSFEENNVVIAGTPAKIVKYNSKAWNEE